MNDIDMFKLNAGSKLIIKGNDNHQIILDGGNTFSVIPENDNKTVTTGINYSGCAIYMIESDLELENVNIITTKGNKNVDYKIDKKIYEGEGRYCTVDRNEWGHTYYFSVDSERVLIHFGDTNDQYNVRLVKSLF